MHTICQHIIEHNYINSQAIVFGPFTLFTLLLHLKMFFMYEEKMKECTIKPILNYRTYMEVLFLILCYNQSGKVVVRHEKYKENQNLGRNEMCYGEMILHDTSDEIKERR